MIRVKYTLNHLGQKDIKYEEESYMLQLFKLLDAAKKEKASPVHKDGFITGNAAFLSQFNENHFIISKSGRNENDTFSIEDFVTVTFFDIKNWKISYMTHGTQNEFPSKPSSDAPLYWASFVEAPKLFNWKMKPKVILHGHICTSQEEADFLNVPCSPKETTFCTPDDYNALMDLLKFYSYPENHIFVRKNHGFFLLADSFKEANDILYDMVGKLKKFKK